MGRKAEMLVEVQTKLTDALERRFPPASSRDERNLEFLAHLQKTVDIVARGVRGDSAQATQFIIRLDRGLKRVSPEEREGSEDVLEICRLVGDLARFDV